MPKNAQRWEWRIDRNGQRVLVPIPFDCACSEPACYGSGGRWLCSKCWQQACMKKETA